MNPDVLPEQLELSRRLSQFIALRWMAVAGTVASLAAARAVFGLQFPVEPAIAVAGAIALYNLIFLLWARPSASTFWRGRVFAHAQIAADMLALTALLHLTGGIENPFFTLYLLHVGLGSLLLPTLDMIWVTGMALTLFGGLVGLEYFEILPHRHLAGLLPAELYRQTAYVVGVLVAFATTLGFVAAMATVIVRELRRHRAAEAEARARELEHVRQELAELDRMRTFFLGLASHHLKTPLAVAVNYIQTILDGYAGEVSPKHRRWLERAVIRLEELLQLINDFLDVAVLDEQRIAAEIEPVQIETIAQWAVDDVAARAQEKNIALQCNITRDLPTIPASSKRLRRLLVNLLDNAIKFTPDGGHVMLVVCEEPDHIRIDVADDGAGIPSDFLPHIFEDYLRTRQREFVPGAGLGLSTARRIVEAHGGKIWVESPYRQDQTGSRFSCLLPKR